MICVRNNIINVLSVNLLIYIEFCYVSKFLYRQIGQTFSTNQRDEVTSILTSLLLFFFFGGGGFFSCSNTFLFNCSRIWYPYFTLFKWRKYSINLILTIRLKHCSKVKLWNPLLFSDPSLLSNDRKLSDMSLRCQFFLGGQYKERFICDV